jgi:hypothetical protein
MLTGPASAAALPSNGSTSLISSPLLSNVSAAPPAASDSASPSSTDVNLKEASADSDVESPVTSGTSSPPPDWSTSPSSTDVNLKEASAGSDVESPATSGTSSPPPDRSTVVLEAIEGAVDEVEQRTDSKSSKRPSKKRPRMRVTARRKPSATALTSKRYRRSESPVDSNNGAEEGDAEKVDREEVNESNNANETAAGVQQNESFARQMYRPRSSHDNTAVKDDVIPNIYLASDDPVEEVKAAAADPKVEAHRELFYQQIQGHYKCTNNRAMMSRRDMDDVVKLIKGDIESKNSTDYKLKKDFAVITYGQHYSLIMSKDVVGKDEIDVSTVPHYCCYKDLFHSIRKCHIDDMGHSGIRKTENAVKNTMSTLHVLWWRDLLLVVTVNWIGSILQSRS